MAVVLPSDKNSYFGTSGLKRSHSQPKFSSSSSTFRTSSSTSRINDLYTSSLSKPYRDHSSPSSVPSSPQTIQADSADLSFSSTPASNVSIVSDCDDLLQFSVNPEDHFVFPDFARGDLHATDELEAPSSPRTGDSYSVSPAEHDASDGTSLPDNLDSVEHAEDDTAVRVTPSRHVDYLSHNWREEDIWSSWKYIVSRRSEYSDAARLENASWRTWIKAKNNLRTVSPETLNWLKDCDVTWLYGPLQTGPAVLGRVEKSGKSSRLSKSSSFVNKKPILKKRSMSEVMLQRSLSNSTLVKQAAAAVQAQENDGWRSLSRPSMGRRATDYISTPFTTSGRMSRENSLAVSTTSSELVSPNSERRHIHFNEQVEQCIAVDIKGDDDDEDLAGLDRYGDSDSDDGAIMMKRTKTKRRPTLARKKSKGPTSSDGKTIVMLPSTTLKDRDDDSDMETAMKHSVYRSPVISPSSSQETLRADAGTLKASKSSRKFFVGDDDDDDSDDSDDQLGYQTPKAGSRSDLTANAREGGLRRSASTNSLNAEPLGMRRTPSGMFMPLDEGEPSTNDGIIGRVIDTVNTARDIAHVIWNDESDEESDEE